MLTPFARFSIGTAPLRVRLQLRFFSPSRASNHTGRPTMKVRSSLKSLKGRHRDCKIVRRKGVLYVINKTDPRFKAKQG